MNSADSAPVRPSSSVLGQGRRKLGDDAGHDDQRNAVAHAARGDLLAEPHEEDGAAGERHHGGRSGTNDVRGR